MTIGTNTASEVISNFPTFSLGIYAPRPPYVASACALCCSSATLLILTHMLSIYTMESGCQDFTHIGCCSFLAGSGAALDPFIHIPLAISSSSVWISPPAPYNT